MKTISINGRTIGPGAPVYFVAELSANHGHDKAIALRTIEAAAKAGADAIKLQTYTPDTITLKSGEPYFVVKTSNAWAGRTLHDLYAEAMTPWEWHAELMDAAASFGLACFSTPFDPSSIAFLESLNVPAHKVASFELNDLPLVEAMARTGKPMIISTGMASLADIDAAVRVCREAGNDQIALLRCVSSYPARPEMIDLASLDVLRGFDTVLGLSDHSPDATVAITAVALGAKIIEKHFILDRSIGGPDAFFSLEPADFANMIKSVRETESAIGRPRFGPSADEIASTAFRRSLFVSADVKAGETLTADNVRSIRPANGLHPKHLPEILGCVATRDLRAATPLRWDAVGKHAPASVALRAADASDSERLFAWRNDATTREMSIDQREVRWDDHHAWLRASLDRADRSLFIAELDAKPVGTARLDATRDGEGRVSITIAPEERGRGRAAETLRTLEDVARERKFVRLIAEIRKENLASLRAFKNAGYYGFRLTGEVFFCERRIAPYA